HIANHQRLTFLAAKRTRRHLPGHLKFPHILGVDLVQFAVARRMIVAQRSYPLIGILRQFVNVGRGLAKRNRRSDHTRSTNCNYENPKASHPVHYGSPHERFLCPILFVSYPFCVLFFLCPIPASGHHSPRPPSTPGRSIST